MENAIHHSITLLADGKNLPHDVAIRAFQIIMNGGATPAQIAAFLMGLRIKGESVEEISAGAEAMRIKAKPFKGVAGSIDTCGTGGDNRGTYNISTTTAFVLAACGLPVVKHGNRSVSSRSGSADVLDILGVRTDCEPEAAERCLAECGITFLFAPKFHTAMRHVAPIREELALRTIFNILGPLTNPAKPDFQLLGVYNKSLLRPMAEVLKSLGTKAAWVVHGSDGLDELTITGSSSVAALKNGEITEFEVSPADADLPTSILDDIKGGNPETNARAFIEAISGVESPYRNAVVYNAAAGLIIAGKADNLKDGAKLAKEGIDSGKAHTILKRLVDVSNSPFRA